MATGKVSVEMVLNAPKKHSVRFDGMGEKAGITSLYVMNDAMNELGQPLAKRIRVTIERID